MARKPVRAAAPAEPDLFSGLERPPNGPPPPEGGAGVLARPPTGAGALARPPTGADARGSPPAPAAKKSLPAASPVVLPPGTALISVALERAVPGTFTYRAEPGLVPFLVPGARVSVPFGPRTVAGYVVGRLTPEEAFREGVPLARLKYILKRLDPPETEAGGAGPLISPPLQALARWMARLYACPLGAVLAAVLPAGVKRGATAQRTRVVTAGLPPAELRAAAEALAKKAPKQAALLHALLAAGTPLLAPELLAEADASSAALKALERHGLVAIAERPAVSLGEAYAKGAGPSRDREGAAETPLADARGSDALAVAGASRRDRSPGAELGLGAPSAAAPPAFRLTGAQEHSLAAILPALAAGEPRTFLLQGVTGSGKTEVYLRVLDAALAQGKQGIVLVPEIALTPQTAQRFEERLGRHGVAVLHSHLTDGERAEAWHAARAGRVGVVIGARSALFAPLERLGCIVLDEEHEGTFKQDSVPRYHAREVALERARAARAVLILGSATPSLESLHAARAGRYGHLLLPERVRGAQLPPVQIVSMQQENRETRRYNYLSRALEHALRETVARREQAILFLNRRGYATVVTCLRCGTTARCDQCDITLTSHRTRKTLTCHYCGGEWPVPETCPTCGAPGVKFWGLGTERVEHAVKELLPAARVARMDSDTMTRRAAYVETLSAFRAGQLDILIGTQMIAKGLDFPNVTLVGIVLADTALHMPDFRSRERTFQLLEQVAGRAGRGEKGGRVLVQTFLPEDPAIQAAARHDYDGFADAELRERKTYAYPPYTRLARVLLRGRDAGRALSAAKTAAEALHQEVRGAAVQVLGPSAAPISMLEGRHRFHLLVKAPDGESLAALFAGPAGRVLQKLKGAEAVVDVDPQSML